MGAWLTQLRRLILILIILIALLIAGCSTGSSDDYIHSGYTFIEEGQYEEAIINFTKAIKLAPDDAKGLIGRAIANAWAGNYQQAEDDFSTAIDLSSGNYTLITDDAYVAWGIALTAQHGSYSKLDEAENLFNSAISLSPNNTDAYTGRAFMHLKAANLEGIDYESSGYFHLKEAVSDFEKAILLDPEGIQGRIKRFNLEGDMALLNNYLEAYRRDGEILVNAYHNYPDAFEAYQKVLEIYPDDVEALIGRGNTYMGLQKYDLALGDFNKANELAPDNPNTYAGCTSIEQLLFMKGNICLEQEKWEEAAYTYSKAIEHNPDFAEAYAQRALAILLDQEYNGTMNCGSEEVIQYTEKALELKPTIEFDKRLARAYVFQGDCYHFKGDDEESIIFYTKALELDPNISCRGLEGIYFDLINDSLAYNEWDKAIEYAKEAIELNTGYSNDFYRQLAEAYYGRGYDHYRHSGLFNEAIEDYTRAIEINPTGVKYYLGRADIYKVLAFSCYERGRINEGKNNANLAIADLRKALELSQDAWQKGQIVDTIRELQELYGIS
jgi:tetratricopeptide (TPR) repeat protein